MADVCTKLSERNELGNGGWRRTVQVSKRPEWGVKNFSVSPLRFIFDKYKNGKDQLSDSDGWKNSAVTAVLPYALHEFGLSSITGCAYTHGRARINEFASWPGFSLNPGVTDLLRLQALLRDSSASTRVPEDGAGTCGGRTCSFAHLMDDGPGFDSCLSGASLLAPVLDGDEHGIWFDGKDAMFEHAFSLRAHAAGAKMAFLPLIVFQHTASALESAYRLQGIRRYWDNETANN